MWLVLPKIFLLPLLPEDIFFRVTSTIQMDQNRTSVVVLQGNIEIASKHH